MFFMALNKHLERIIFQVFHMSPRRHVPLYALLCCAVQLQTALGSFHVPLRPICHTTEVEFGDQVRNLTRRFFHHLLR